MLVEIPNFRRCCCCVPLRQGILTFAYLNLGITLFFGILQLLIWLFFHGDMRYHAVGMFRGVMLDVQIFFVIALHALDVVFNVVLIVGAHMKNKMLMRVYYFYQLTTMITNFFALLITSYLDHEMPAVLTKLAIAFIAFVVQIYLLLLIHSELKKQRYQEGRSSFVNKISEVCVEPSAHEN